MPPIWTYIPRGGLLFTNKSRFFYLTNNLKTNNFDINISILLYLSTKPTKSLTGLTREFELKRAAI